MPKHVKMSFFQTSNFVNRLFTFHFAVLMTNSLLELEGLRPKIESIQMLGHVLSCKGLGPWQGQGVRVHPLLHALNPATDLVTHPEVVKGSRGEALPCDVLRQGLHHARFLHGDDGSGYQLPVVPDCEVPGPYPQKVVKVEFNYQPTLCINFCEHGLPMLGDHGGLVAVEGDRGLVEGLFGMP